MSRLKPGATYIYERVEGTIYAREAGKKDRFVIGYDYDLDTKAGLKEDQLWADIRHAATDNPTLRSALEQCIIIYELSKQHG